MKKTYMQIFILFLTILLFSENTIAQKSDEIETTERKDSAEYKTETIDVDALKGFKRLTPITFENIREQRLKKSTAYRIFRCCLMDIQV